MRSHVLSFFILSLCGAFGQGCEENDDPSKLDASTTPVTGEDGGDETPTCPGDNGSLALPQGFCATVFADDVGVARHMVVTPKGDVFVALGSESGGVLGLRDTDSDGVADEEESFGDRGGNGILWRDGQLFFAENARIVRYELPLGALEPEGKEMVIVEGLPDDQDHPAKAIAFDANGDLVVNIASASNSCQENNREKESKGIDPCPELEERAGLWRFNANREGQKLADGERIVTGVRNATAIALNPNTNVIWAVINGRDQLHENWPELFTAEDDAALPGEEMWPVVEGDDHGWPYCYYDPAAREMRLAPEYGGDGTMVGRCADVTAPATSLPAHWAPLSLHFYRGETFPSSYRQGVFVASHGSRFSPDAQGSLPGYNVVFIPITEGIPGAYEPFAEGFAGPERPLPDEAAHRPVGLAEGPDGALYVSDDKGGRIWKIPYVP